MELMIIVLIFAGAGFYAVALYNGIVAAATRVEQGWSGVAVQLKRRHDLTPVLVDAVRVAVRHDEGMLERTLEARKQALAALAGGDREAVAASEKTLGDALGRLIAYVEAYPEIRASDAVVTLQRQLEETEDQIAAARRLYNGNVQNYNERLVTFPGNLVAARMKAQPATYFAMGEAEARAAEIAPRIDAATLDATRRAQP